MKMLKRFSSVEHPNAYTIAADLIVALYVVALVGTIVYAFGLILEQLTK